MKRFLSFGALLLIMAGLLVSCYENVIEGIQTEDVVGDIIAARINTDATSNEILSVRTVNGENITYYGTKKENGTADFISAIECEDSKGIVNLIKFDNNGKLTSIDNDCGVSIEFEWINDKSAIVVARSHKDNQLFSTTVDFSAPSGEDEMPSAKVAASGTRQGELKLDILPAYDNPIPELLLSQSDVQYDPDDYPPFQEMTLWIYQCGTSFNAKNYLLLKDADTGFQIGKLVNYEKLTKGTYIYKLPLSSFPSSATNAELCLEIDRALLKIEECISGALTDTTPIIVAINSAAVATGIGVVPVVIVDALMLSANVFNLSLGIFNLWGGVRHLMQLKDAEWYYKEYIISEIDVVPVAFTQDKTVMGDKQRVKPGEDGALITLDMQGEPVLSSFVLSPSNPSEGQSYTATAEFHCIPSGSQITLTIVGTDDYKDSITKTISENGTAVLHVPGAETGVVDKCTATISMPFGQTLYLDASLVFGY